MSEIKKDDKMEYLRVISQLQADKEVLLKTIKILTEDK